MKLTAGAAKLLIDEERRRTDEWLASSLRRWLIGLFFAFLVAYIVTALFYALPLSVAGDSTMCSVTTTTVRESPAEDPISIEEETSCERRGLPAWLVAVGPVLVVAPLLALLFQRPGRVRATVKGPGGEEAAEIEATDSFTAMVEAMGNRAKKSAAEFPGAE